MFRGQDTIAAALGDVNGLLAGLDRLIAQKRDLKRTAMQPLLTTKTQLPGFRGEWEVADIRSGGTPTTTEERHWHGDVPGFPPTDITAINGHKHLGETTRMMTQQGLNVGSAEMIPADSIRMTSRATMGACTINSIPVSPRQGFKNFVPFAETDADLTALEQRWEKTRALKHGMMQELMTGWTPLV